MASYRKTIFRYPFLSHLVAFGAVALLIPISAYAQDRGSKKPLAGYDTLIVEEFTIETTVQEFPEGHEVVLQKGTVARLRKKGIFRKVIDATKMSDEVKSQEAESKKLILSGTVVDYDKGSRKKRYFIGFGAGATKVEVLFVFRDEKTGNVLLRKKRKGKFAGMYGFAGGSEAQGVSEAVGDVVDGLIKDVKKNR